MIMQKKKWAWPWARGAPRNFCVPFNTFAMAEIAMAVPNKQSLYTSVTDAHIENSKNWN